MKKKRNLIGVCLVAVLMLALTVIGYAAGDGEAAPEYGAWCLVPPLVTIVLAFVTKQTIISMFIGIWVGATIIHHFNPIDGLIGSFTGYLVPSIADSWNAVARRPSAAGPRRWLTTAKRASCWHGSPPSYSSSIRAACWWASSCVPSPTRPISPA